jgi:hypothetical protein
VANVHYPEAKELWARKLLHWEDDDIRALAVRDAGAYDPAHVFVSDLLAGGGKEITVPGYSRQLVGSRSLVLVSGLLEFRLGNILFGSALAAGQIVKAVVLYQRVTSDPDSRLIYWMDTAPAPNDLPWTTDGGPFGVNFPSGRIMRW